MLTLSSQQACGQKKDNCPLVHRVSLRAGVVVCFPCGVPGYDAQVCPWRKGLIGQDKTALFTEKVVLYYNDQFERLR
jgi:hypothetical protein